MEEINIDQIVATIFSIINLGKTPALPIPPPLVLTGGFTRTGMSARDMAKEVILRQQEAGVPIGNLPSGAENISEKMERIRMEVIIKHLLENAKFTVVIPAGVPVTATGASPVGPVVVQGVTVGLGTGTAVMS
jgi:hypothetical protein